MTPTGSPGQTLAGNRKTLRNTPGTPAPARRSAPGRHQQARPPEHHTDTGTGCLRNHALSATNRPARTRSSSRIHETGLPPEHTPGLGAAMHVPSWCQQACPHTEHRPDTGTGCLREDALSAVNRPARTKSSASRTETSRTGAEARHAGSNTTPAHTRSTAPGRRNRPPETPRSWRGHSTFRTWRQQACPHREFQPHT